ncbi:MAG: LysM peptidoglycan-binding domain-containing protein [Treponematales bacterium]
MAQDEIKDIPTPGYIYEVKKNDTLADIAYHAYKDASKWPLIAEINAQRLKSYSMSNEQLRKKGKDYVGHPENLIMPGERIFIPELVTIQPPNPQPTDPENITPPEPDPVSRSSAYYMTDAIFDNIPKFPKGSVVFGMVYASSVGATPSLRPIRSFYVEWYVPYQGRFVYGVDILARAWNGTFLWNPEQSKGYDLQRKAVVTNHFNEVIKSLSFARSCIVIDGKLMGTDFIGGRKYKITPNASSVECRYHSKTYDLIRSDTPAGISPASSMPNKTFGEFMKWLLDHMGIGFKDYVQDPTPYPFNPIEGGGTQKCGAFLQTMAAQHGSFLMDDEYGNVIVHKIANKPSEKRPLCHLEFGNQTAGNRFGQFATEWEADYDDLGFYNTYNAYGPSQDLEDYGKAKTSETRTPTMNGFPLAPPPSVINLSTENCQIANDVKNLILWTITKTWMDAREFRVPVGTWYNEYGELWRAGDLVDIFSPITETMFTKRRDFKGRYIPMRCVIREIEFEWTGDSRRCILTVCPVFSLKEDGTLSDMSHRGFML